MKKLIATLVVAAASVSTLLADGVFYRFGKMNYFENDNTEVMSDGVSYQRSAQPSSIVVASINSLDISELPTINATIYVENLGNLPVNFDPTKDVRIEVYNDQKGRYIGYGIDAERAKRRAMEEQKEALSNAKVRYILGFESNLDNRFNEAAFEKNMDAIEANAASFLKTTTLESSKPNCLGLVQFRPILCLDDTINAEAQARLDVYRNSYPANVKDAIKRAAKAMVNPVASRFEIEAECDEIASELDEDELIMVIKDLMYMGLIPLPDKLGMGWGNWKVNVKFGTKKYTIAKPKNPYEYMPTIRDEI